MYTTVYTLYRKDIGKYKKPWQEHCNNKWPITTDPVNGSRQLHLNERICYLNNKKVKVCGTAIRSNSVRIQYVSESDKALLYYILHELKLMV